MKNRRPTWLLQGVVMGLLVLGCSASDDRNGGTAGRGGSTSGGTTGGTAGTGGTTGGSAGTGGASGSGGSSGSAGTGVGDGGVGTASCREVQMCQNSCRNTACREACLASGTLQAQELTRMLSECIAQACPTGSPSNCRIDVQCAASGVCRMLNETCVEMSPDPDCP